MSLLLIQTCSKNLAEREGVHSCVKNVCNAQARWSKNVPKIPGTFQNKVQERSNVAKTCQKLSRCVPKIPVTFQNKVHKRSNLPKATQVHSSYLPNNSPKAFQRSKSVLNNVQAFHSIPGTFPSILEQAVGSF